MKRRFFEIYIRATKSRDKLEKRGTVPVPADNNIHTRSVRTVVREWHGHDFELFAYVQRFHTLVANSVSPLIYTLREQRRNSRYNGSGPIEGTAVRGIYNFIVKRDS